MNYLLLFLLGIGAGFINTLAGGGSLLTIPALLFLGLPAQVANATNRVGILLQTLTGSYRFHKAGHLEFPNIIHITISAIVGAILGSFFAIKISSEIFDIILAFILFFLLILMLKPKSKKTTNSRHIPKWIECVIFVAIGFYGGFIQAGVGFIFLASLNLIGNFNLVKANAIKVFIIFCYTLIAVLIFTLSDKIIWSYGLILAAGTSLGAFIAVKTALKNGEKIIKIVITIAVIAAILKLFNIF